MIPKKESKDIDLNEAIDKDIEKSKKQQEEKIKKNKPKLAQAVGSKYAKIIVVVVFGIIIGYKMFFAPAPEPVKKKKNKSTISKNTNDDNQKQFANSGISKTKGEINTKKVETKQIISLDNQTFSNEETLNSVPVPKLTLPTVPEIPKIDKLTIKEVVEEKKTIAENGKEINKDVSLNNNNSLLDKNKQIENNESKKNNDNLKIKSNNKTKKIKRKIKDSSGKTVIVTEEVEVDKNGNIINNNDLQNLADNSVIKEMPLSQQMNNEVQELKNKAKDNYKNKNRMQDISNIGLNSLEEMFILSGKGSTNSKSSNTYDNKNDFIIFDNSTIQEKEILQESNSSANVSRIANLENTIVAGKIIEGTLARAINSESSGTISAVISKDVYGESGNKILIPKGSRAYGSYAVTETKFQRRLLLNWTKIIRPDGIVITMVADGYDQSGKKGIEGDIDTRYGDMFKNSLLYSFLTLGASIAMEKLTGVKNSTTITAGGTTVTNSPVNTAITSVIDTASDVVSKMTDGLTDDINPVASIPQGTIVNIISTQDIVIPFAYKSTNINQID